ncbi:MAG: FMN-dependent NADH-azoreductase 1 [Chroococcidiopsis sp. SAG 2025]|uniref:NAD(P)H-dependent oxidoreductase n=1 Tax=Chroococcidiopsis sp. SAG 2025 TaxID=171389 RepID=UPI0029372714|nr:NAD(P)H-dependent oxidoreductase [Chroococcidiopsis sp. SAG 2025]MDV2996898.1 FMN-dependent NADH-azoreductase 1 [Chroococcidiopsis sp. SAG 2025]
MTHLLHIDTSPRGERSISRTLAKLYITDWQAAHPNDVVTYRDIGHYPVPFVSEAWIAGAYTPPEQHSPESIEAMRISDELVNKLYRK